MRMEEQHDRRVSTVDDHLWDRLLLSHLSRVPTHGSQRLYLFKPYTGQGRTGSSGEEEDLPSWFVPTHVGWSGEFLLDILFDQAGWSNRRMWRSNR